jgi:predicted DNA-binding transcriptional regulator YafY
MMEILKHGSDVEVLELVWLRKKVIMEIRAAGKKYRG